MKHFKVCSFGKTLAVFGAKTAEEACKLAEAVYGIHTDDLAAVEVSEPHGPYVKEGQANT